MTLDIKHLKESDYYNTLKAKDKQGNRLHSGRKKQRRDIRVSYANSSNKKQNVVDNDDSDDDKFFEERSVINFAVSGELSDDVLMQLHIPELPYLNYHQQLNRHLNVLLRIKMTV